MKPFPAEREIMKKWKDGARRRGKTWNLSLEQCVEIMHGECIYCGKSKSNTTILHDRKDMKGIAFSYNSPDRLNNKIGYEPDNVVSACWQCNRGKGNMEYDNFIEYLDNLVEFRLEVNRVGTGRA